MKARRGAERRPANYTSSMGGKGSCSLEGSLGDLGGFFGAYERVLQAKESGAAQI